MSNDAKATSTRRPGRPKAGSEDKKARILSKALTLFQRRATRPRPSRTSRVPPIFRRRGSCITTRRRISCSRPSWTSVIVASSADSRASKRGPRPRWMLG